MTNTDIEDDDLLEDCPFCAYYDDLFSQMRDDITMRRRELMNVAVISGYLQ